MKISELKDLEVNDIYYGTKNNSLQEIRVEDIIQDDRVVIRFAPINDSGVCIGSVTTETISIRKFNKFGKTIIEAKAKAYNNAIKDHHNNKAELFRKLKNNDDHLQLKIDTLFGGKMGIELFIDKHPEYFV